jgi:hypothetical protein
MVTRYRIMRPDGTNELREVDWPSHPNYERIRDLVAPLIDNGSIECVHCLADFEGGTNYQRSDMIVDENFLERRLPRNEAATKIYRRAAMLRMPGREAETLPPICGTALLFDRIIWN